MPAQPPESPTEASVAPVSESMVVSVESPISGGVVVSIGLDHVKTLGPTIEKIAAEKAGIVKSGMPVVSGVVQTAAREVLVEACERAGAFFIDGRERVALERYERGGFALHGEHGTYDDLRVGLAGPHQIDNARIAVAAFECLMERFGETTQARAVREGLARVHWPGRLQWIDRDAGQPRMLLDGAHNPEGIRCVAEYLQDHPLDKNAVLLFGATSGKPLGELLKPLAGHCRTIVIGRPPVERDQLLDRRKACRSFCVPPCWPLLCPFRPVRLSVL